MTELISALAWLIAALALLAFALFLHRIARPIGRALDRIGLATVQPLIARFTSKK